MAANIGTAYVRVLASGRGFDDSVEDQFDKAGPTFAKSGKKSGDIFGKEFDAAWTKKFEAGLAKLYKKPPKIALDAPSDKDLKRFVKSFSSGLKEIRLESDRASDNLSTFRRGMDRFTISLRESQERADKFGDTFGKVFGKGARNDFVNIVGSITGFLAKMSARFVGLLESLPVVNRLLGSGAGGFGGALAGFARTAPVIIAALAAVTLGLGLMTAAASGLLGILTALASVGFFGLVAAAGAAAGALVPLTLGIGALVLAITHLSDAQKEKLEPVGDAFHDLGDAAAESFGPHLTKNVDQFVSILEGMEPVVRDVSRAMGTVLDDFMKDLESPAWDRFGDRFSRFLPNAVESLGTSMRNAVGGMAGVFESLIPLTRRFLGWLEGITGEFQEWAQSREGQRQLRDFFEKAGDSAAALGDFVGAAAEALVKLFDAGNERGIDILDRMTAKIQEFADWITSPEGQKALEDWFQQAEDLAVEIGGLVDDLIEFFDELDSEENRQALNDFVDTMGRLVGVFEETAEVMGIVLGPLLWLLGVFVKINEELDELTGRNLIEWVNPLASIPELIGKIDFGAIGEQLSRLPGLVNRALATIPAAIVKTIGRGIGTAVSGIVSQFTGLGGRILNRIGKIDWERLASGIGRAVTALLNAFPAVAERVLQRIMPIDWERLASGVGRAVSALLSEFAGLAGKILDKILPIDWNRLGQGLQDFINGIPGMFAGLGGQIASRIGDITVNVIPKISGGVMGQKLPKGDIWKAEGGVLHSPRMLIAGEAGPEAIVPLSRPLSQVDPAVRWLSAIAQGLTPPPTPMASGGVVGQRPIELTVITPTEDPFAVASEVINRLVPVGY